MNYQFKYPPILVGGKAMEYYGLRKCGKDIDYVVHKSDYRRMLKIEKPNKTMIPQTPGITYTGGKKDTDYYLNLYQFDYNRLKQNAVKKGNMLIVSREDLILVKTMALNNKKYVIKNKKDIQLLAKSLVRSKYSV